MRTTLDAAYHWRRKTYGPGEAVIPDDLAAALGLPPAEPKAEGREQKAAPPELPDDGPGFVPPDAPPRHEEEPYALTLINSAEAAEDMTPIKGIGIGGARELMANRPDGGYASLAEAEELNPKLSKAPYNVKWEQVAQWEPEA